MQNFHELIQGFHNFKEDYFLREREFFSSLVHGLKFTFNRSET